MLQEQHEIFAGLYLIFRLVINVSYVFTTWLAQYIVQQIVCTVFIVLLAICQPYNEEKKLFNYVDILIFGDLAIINALSLYLYSYSQNHPGLPPPHAAFVIQYTLVFLPLAYMTTYVTWYVMKPCHRRVKLTVRQVITYCQTCFRGHDYQLLDDIAGNSPSVTKTNSIIPQDDSEDHIEAMLKRAELENTYRPSSANVTTAAPEIQRPPVHSEDSAMKAQQSSSSGSGQYGSVGHSTCSLGQTSESQTSDEAIGTGKKAEA